jgi:hypothetical protein
MFLTVERPTARHPDQIIDIVRHCFRAQQNSC